MNTIEGLIVLIAVIAAARGVWSPCGLSMVSAINPFTERARGNRYWLTAVWFITGAVLGGALLGGLGAAVAWVFAPLSGPVRAALAAGCCLVTLASDVSLTRFHLPLHPRQVNERWLSSYRRWVYAGGFGAQIGAGITTYIMTAAVYLVPVIGALSGSPLWAVLTGVLFGLVRGAAVLLSSTATSPERLGRLHLRLESLAPASRLAAIAVQALGALVFGAIAGRLAVVVVVLVLALAVRSMAVRHTARRNTHRTTSPEAPPGRRRSRPRVPESSDSVRTHPAGHRAASGSPS